MLTYSHKNGFIEHMRDTNWEPSRSICQGFEVRTEVEKYCLFHHSSDLDLGHP